MGSNSWREIKTKYTNDYHFTDCWYKQQLFYEGKYYWQVCGFDRGHNLVHKFILSFDMADELFYEISLPWQYTETYGGTQGRLAVWKGSIALVSFEHEIVGPQSFDIWVMMNNSCGVKSPWTKYLTIGPMEGINIPVVYPLVFWKNDELVMVAVDGRVVRGGPEGVHIVPSHKAFGNGRPPASSFKYIYILVQEKYNKVSSLYNLRGLCSPVGRLATSRGHSFFTGSNPRLRTLIFHFSFLLSVSLIFLLFSFSVLIFLSYFLFFFSFSFFTFVLYYTHLFIFKSLCNVLQKKKESLCNEHKTSVKFSHWVSEFSGPALRVFSYNLGTQTFK
ncbi:putative F-box associated domain, type 3 [Rosa chinensis]|uniref:Putative F-box associated domain, type 3 n=1 Tax=Rosa chinensis TaxID=74649 RepID=A0A2P6QW23_ROSCH|nr:putative F-box associated domain, type 3 [Rosa chinensis]